MGSAIQKYTPNGGYKGLEMCLRSIPAEHFKNSHPTYSFFFFFFSDRKGIFLYATTISVACHMSPNELICLTPATIRRSVVFRSIGRPFICLPSSKMIF